MAMFIDLSVKSEIEREPCLVMSLPKLEWRHLGSNHRKVVANVRGWQLLVNGQKPATAAGELAIHADRKITIGDYGYITVTEHLRRRLMRHWRRRGRPAEGWRPIPLDRSVLGIPNMDPNFHEFQQQPDKFVELPERVMSITSAKISDESDWSQLHWDVTRQPVDAEWSMEFWGRRDNIVQLAYLSIFCPFVD